MSACPASLRGLLPEYRDAGDLRLEGDVLGAVVYGPTRVRDDPRIINVNLEPGRSGGSAEVWRVPGTIVTGRDGRIRFAATEDHLFGILEVDERECGGIEAAAEEAYRAVVAFQRRVAQPHLLRMWNYLDAINDGEGDFERYRRFCLGRARGLGEPLLGRYPAGTAIGRKDGVPLLQVYWLAGRAHGRPIENPRQLQAWRYPPRYGPAPPSFSRAMLLDSGELMVSGTASIVGHASCHADNLFEQLEETLENVQQLFQTADGVRRLNVMKAYVRPGHVAELVAEAIRKAFPACSEVLVLEADICREELLIEVECVAA